LLFLHKAACRKPQTCGIAIFDWHLPIMIFVMKKRLFAIGDIHGCYESLRELIEHKIKIRESDKLILLGDYIDRGDQSREVIDYIIELKEKDFDIVALIGNHESMLLDALDNDIFLPGWIQNGGSETMISFGINSLKQLDQVYIDFFKGLQFYYLLSNFLFVHAGFNDRISNPFDDKYHMIWSRREKYTNPVLRDKIIIHGHTPVPQLICKQEIQNHNHVINIDTGCVYADVEGYGRLSAFEMYSKELFSV
jgi:serine/threonine protein phosphatase 1